MLARHLLRPVSEDDEQGHIRHVAGEEAEEVEARGVAPVEIVEEQGERSVGREGGEERTDFLEEYGSARHVAGNAGAGKCRREGGRLVTGVIRAEQLYPRTVGGSLGEIITASDKDERCPLTRVSAERLGERGLADPRLTADQHQAALPGEGASESLAKDGEFAVPPDKARRGASGRRSWVGWYSDRAPPHGYASEQITDNDLTHSVYCIAAQTLCGQ